MISFSSENVHSTFQDYESYPLGIKLSGEEIRLISPYSMTKVCYVFPNKGLTHQVLAVRQEPIMFQGLFSHICWLALCLQICVSFGILIEIK